MYLVGIDIYDPQMKCLNINRKLNTLAISLVMKRI
jgi:hypothetical protein